MYTDKIQNIKQDNTTATRVGSGGYDLMLVVKQRQRKKKEEEISQPNAGRKKVENLFFVVK